MRLYWAFILCCGVALAAPKPVDFDREIRPILSDNCFHCHGPDEKKRMAGVRLDTPEGAFAKRGDAAIISPGHAESSKLFQRITHAKPAMRMPPAYSGFKLTDAQIQLINRWISEGAKWERHWSLTPPKAPEMPVVKAKSWVRNPIDQLVLARVEREGLKPSPEASKETLLRRVSFDLTGLPPTDEELNAFLKDKSADAYEKQVDRLLASPKYGERMAMQWLDLARYSDTHGYHIDSHRVMWPWRDWVISAFNRNMSYKDFLEWQLAGDLLPNATREQKVATGFNRNHMINFEGGAIPEEYQAEYMVDRADTTSTVFMGLTMGCARCHDHKYDPIRQRDYYRFAAFFNNVSDQGLDGREGNAKPFLSLPTDEQQKKLDEIVAAIASRKKEIEDAKPQELESAWRQQISKRDPVSPLQSLEAWYELDGSLSDLSGHFRNGRIETGDVTYSNGPVRKAGEFGSTTNVKLPADVLHLEKPFTMAFWLRVGRQNGQPVLEKLDRNSDKPFGLSVALGRPQTLPHLKRAHNLEIRWTAPDGHGLRARTDGLPVIQEQFHHYTLISDGTGKAKGVQLFLDGRRVDLVVEQDDLPAVAAIASPVEIGNPKPGPAFKGRLDDVRFYSAMLPARGVEQLAIHFPAEVLAGTHAQFSKEEQERLDEYFLTYQAPERLRQAQNELKKLQTAKLSLEDEIPNVMVMDEMEKPRDTFILARGDYQNKQEKVDPGTPAMLPPLKVNGRRANRLDLANWLTAPEHPLTSRVAVNRLWQMDFGMGLVKTSEDFGSQGDPPANPELLDWLATEFVRSNWDIKAMQRLIVTSATYRQSSKVTPALLEKDPENRLLARGPRYRMPAEMVRDSALATSGLLNAKVGGPSVLPYQPPGLWEELSFGEAYSAQEYEQSHGDDLYRRSMYTFWKRTVPPASMSTFDAPDREKCAARRPVTNTPLQALVTLNDPTYIEASRHLAARVLTEQSKGSNDERLRYAFRIVTDRWPSKAELAVLKSSLEQEIATYKKDPKAAEELLSVGESPVPSTMDKPQLAAWTNMATILYNLDEVITKE